MTGPFGVPGGLEKYPESRYADYAFYSVGWTYEQQGEFQKAIQTYGELPSKYPRSGLAPASRVRVGAVYLNQREPKKAISALNAAMPKIETEDGRGEAQYLIGEAHYQLGDNASALKAYDEFLATYRTHRLERDVRYARGWIYLQEGNYARRSAYSTDSPPRRTRSPSRPFFERPRPSSFPESGRKPSPRSRAWWRSIARAECRQRPL